MNKDMNRFSSLWPLQSRRRFIAQTGLASAAAALWPADAAFAAGPARLSPPIVVFSKIYQELKLNFDEAAEATAQAELPGIDCPVRAGGEVLPERVGEDLPRYAEALRKRNLKIALITSGITSTASPNAEQVLQEAKKLGVKFYRLGFIERKTDGTAQQLAEIKAQLKDLAALNKQVGLCSMLQNHSPSGHGYIGGDVGELHEIVKGFDPAEVGVAFDIGHALVVHGDKWPEYFERIKSHLKVAYVKDVKRPGRWVAFGQGDVAQSGYFTRLKEMNYNAPMSLHIEYDWAEKGTPKTRPALVNVVKHSADVLKKWLAEA
jgi:L-ribulose-5-phosphate 3-epimerase